MALPLSGILQTTVDGKPARTGWSGPWPPPQDMLLCTGRTTHLVTWSDPQTVLERGGLDASHMIEFRALRRISCSTLDDDVVGHPHLMRVAVYEVTGPWPG